MKLTPASRPSAAHGCLAPRRWPGGRWEFDVTQTTLIIYGQSHTIAGDSAEPPLYVLRDLGFKDGAR
jgi:hypothetical protein